MSLSRNECVVAVGECTVQPASARRSAIKYNETGFAVLRADASMCNVQRKHAETNVVVSTQSLEQPEPSALLPARSSELIACCSACAPTYAPLACSLRARSHVHVNRSTGQRNQPEPSALVPARSSELITCCSACATTYAPLACSLLARSHVHVNRSNGQRNQPEPSALLTARS